MRPFLLTSALAGLTLAACAASPGAGTTDEPMAEAPPPYQVPATLAEATEGPSSVALFEVGDEDTTVYLMGTVHILRPDVAWKTPAYEAAFEAADAVFLEADTESPEVIAALGPMIGEMGVNPEGVTFSSYFEAEERQALDAALAGIGVPMAALEPYRPWLAATQIAVVGIQQLGGDPNAGVDKMIAGDAAAAGKDLRYFETARGQIEIIAGVPDEAWADSLVADIDEMADFEGYFAGLVGAWYDGRLDVVGEIMNDGMSVSPELAEAVLYRRNADWAEQLAELIETEEGTFLVAVGAGHLGGEKSVQDYLAERGYEAERAD